MRQQGRAEFAALQAFLKAAGESNRTDLARFVLRTNAALFTTDMTPVFWTGGLQGSGPPRLADRLDTQRAALAVPRQMEILEGWQQRAIGVGYFDEGYQAQPDVEGGLGSGSTATASRLAREPWSRCSNRFAGRLEVRPPLAAPNLKVTTPKAARVNCFSDSRLPTPDPWRLI